MKIVYIHDAIACIGGVERIFAEKMNYLADVLGYEVYLITCIQGKHPYSFSLSSNIQHIELGVRLHDQYKYHYPQRMWKKWKLNREFKHLLQKKIDQINPHIIVGTTYWKADVLCKIKTSAKKVIESHNARPFTGLNDGTNRMGLIDILNRISVIFYQQYIEKRSDLIVTLTNGDAREWKKAKDVRVIPNMTHPADINNQIEKKKNHVISVGRLHHQKGFDLLVSAWSIVGQKHKDWMLDIYGDNGFLKQDIEKQIRDFELSNEIMLHNPTREIFSKYQESEFYVMSSRYEGWGLVLVEAMACGIPCIAFDCPYGPSDIIEHGKNGLLVKNGDIQGLADAICWMIEHEEEQKQMGIAAKETSKRYAPEVIMKQWNELFKELVNQ